ncbi:hypothetical protein JXJ21_23295 [candidate division KSB1 bacterium]|nr:hypothetical protein [candidate division KSB1 bacterium]
MQRPHFKYFLTGSLMFAVVSILSCYTMLQHPVVVESAEEETYESQMPIDVQHNQDCIQCHQQAHHQVYLYGQDFYADDYHWRPSWQYYNYTPWWVNSFYYSSGADENTSSDDLPRPTDFGRRRRSGDDSGSFGSGINSQSSGSSSMPSLSKQKSDSESTKRSADGDASGKRTITRRQRSDKKEEAQKESDDKKRKR